MEGGSGYFEAVPKAGYIYSRHPSVMSVASGVFEPVPAVGEGQDGAIAGVS